MGKAERVTILAFHAVLLKVNDKRKTLLVLKTNRFDDLTRAIRPDKVNDNKQEA